MEASAVEKNNTVQSVYFFAYLVVSLFSLLHRDLSYNKLQVLDAALFSKLQHLTEV